MHDIADKILYGECDGCDWDPIQCLACGQCHYEEEEAEDDTYEFAMMEAYDR